MHFFNTWRFDIANYFTSVFVNTNIWWSKEQNLFTLSVATILKRNDTRELLGCQKQVKQSNRSVYGIFLLVLQCDPLLLVGHIYLCDPLQNQIFILFGQKCLYPKVTLLYCLQKKFTRSKEFYLPTHKRAKILGRPYMVARAFRG
jgi:hypothetical protein